jgi:hypothetical protein
MNLQSNETFGLELSIESVESMSLSNGNDSFVIFLKVDNTTLKNRNIKILKTTYLTTEREQIEQDNWLNGYFVEEDILKPNSFKKSGLLFYKPKLNKISNNDVLYISVELPQEGKEVTFCFQNKSDNWNIINIEENEIKIKLTPNQIENYLLNRIERLEVFEEKFGISLENISILNDSSGLSIYAELKSLNGTTISHKKVFSLKCIFYDLEGKILYDDSKWIYPESFIGFELIKFSFYRKFESNEESIGKIRIYPN